jgi:hypothetical protein
MPRSPFGPPPPLPPQPCRHEWMPSLWESYKLDHGVEWAVTAYVCRFCLICCNPHGEIAFTPLDVQP